MPVLRSREIVPVIKSKPPGEALDVRAFEPDTPAKNGEGFNGDLNVSPLTPDNGTVGVGLGPVAIQRRSARLASKSSLGLTEVVQDVKPSSCKRKKSDSGDNVISINGFNLDTQESEDQGDVENGDFHLRTKEARVADAIDSETGVLEDINQLGEGAGLEMTKLEANDTAVSADLGTSKLNDDRVENMRKGQRQRKTGTGILWGLEHAGQAESEKRFLHLRSGKKIAKIRVQGEDLHTYNDAGSNNHCSKQSGNILEDVGANSGTRNKSDADKKEAENGGFESGMSFSSDEKGKQKVLEENYFTRPVGSLKLDLEVKEVSETEAALGNEMQVLEVKEVAETEAAIENEMQVDTRGTMGTDKGKKKLVDTDTVSKSNSTLEYEFETSIKVEIGRSVSGSSDSTLSPERNHDVKVMSSPYGEKKRGYQERFRDIAKRNASRFAHFSYQSEEEEIKDVADAAGRVVPSEANGGKEDWPGPFSTAMKIIRDRQMNASLQHHISCNKNKAASVLWVPSKDEKCNLSKKVVPSLQDLCLSILVKNADAITSLDCVPDVLRHKLSHFLCNSRKMNSHFLELLVHGSPTEIHLRDCSWLTEDDFIRAFERCDLKNLTVLQLDQCGRCLPDYILSTTLVRSPESLPVLTALSLRGAYRFSDVGISVLVSSAPALRSINLSQCSLLTSDGICCLADSLGSVLRELYIEDCQGIDAMLILRALLKIDNLEVLSLAGIENVSDEFVHEFVCIRGHNMKELVLANCTKLTDLSLRIIAEMCPNLCAIDLSNLCKLTDAAMAYLANGCRTIQKLKLCRNTFSDEAIAAYLETCGEPLKELSLSNVITVAQNTAISLARHSRNLNGLDLSWCRSLTDEALGLIVDSCLSLKVLKVFGCTQITEVFLSGHSNPEVQIIGRKLKPILEHLNSPDFLQGPLRYSFVPSFT